MIEFERITEEQAGIPSGNTAKFITELKKRRVCLHSVLLFRSGKLFFEEYAPGFDKNTRHRLYSVSKTYTSAAIGRAIGDGYITLETRVADYFKDKLPENIHPFVKELTVRDCLTMSTPFDDCPYNHTHSDWLKDFFTATPTHRGGSIFRYDTGATLVMCALIERVTGLPFNEYLYNTVLSKIGYESAPPCVESPEGTKWGGSGVQCTPRELAAFALLMMNGGKNRDSEQLIPESYVKAATSKQIGNAEDNKQTYLRGYGYGYQTWMMKKGWAMYGMGNQLAFCFPEEDILFVCTGDDQGNDFARNFIIEYMFDYILTPISGEEKEEENDTSLCLPLPMGEKYSPLQTVYSGKTYELSENRAGIEEISFVFGENQCEMNFSARGEKKQLVFGLGKYIESEFPEKHYSGERINTPINRGYRCSATAKWDMENLLVLKCYATDYYLGNITLNVRFSDKGIDMHFIKYAEWFFDEYQGFATG